MSIRCPAAISGDSRRNGFAWSVPTVPTNDAPPVARPAARHLTQEQSERAYRTGVRRKRASNRSVIVRVSLIERRTIAPRPDPDVIGLADLQTFVENMPCVPRMRIAIVRVIIPVTPVVPFRSGGGPRPRRGTRWPHLDIDTVVEREQTRQVPGTIIDIEINPSFSGHGAIDDAIADIAHLIARPDELRGRDRTRGHDE